MFEIALEQIVKSLASMVVQRSLNLVQGRAAELHNTIRLNKSIAIKSLTRNNEFILQWAPYIKTKDMEKPKHLDDVYVTLKVQNGLQRDNILGTINQNNQDMLFSTNEISLNEHSILYGELGSGKTTTVQNLSLKCLKHHKRCTIVILFRDIQDSRSIIDVILSIFGVEVEHDQNRSDLENKQKYRFEDDREYKINILARVLSDLNAILFLDGIDEAPDTYIGNYIRDIIELSNKGVKINTAEVPDESTGISMNNDKSEYNANSLLEPNSALQVGLKKKTKRIQNFQFAFSTFLTCRTGEIEQDLPNFRVLQLFPLTSDQISTLSRNWLSDDKQFNNFISSISKNTYFDLCSKPLTLSILLSIFEKYGRLPDQPKSIYKKAIALYLEEWDAQRGIDRSSKYSNLTPEAKFEFLSSFAFELHRTTNGNSLRFDSRACRIVYNNVYSKFHLPSNEATMVVSDIEATTSIFRKTGHDEFEFVHKSIQEYLVADYLSRLGSLNKLKLDASNLPNELSIMISLSSDPNERLHKLVNEELDFSSKDGRFCRIFISRLIMERPGFLVDPALGEDCLRIIVQIRDKFEEIAPIIRSDSAINQSIKHYLSDIDLAPNNGVFIQHLTSGNIKKTPQFISRNTISLMVT